MIENFGRIFDLLASWLAADEYMKIIIVLGSLVVIFSVFLAFILRYALDLLPDHFLNQKCFRRLSGITRWISQSPYTIGVLYFMLIPSFAGFYASLPENSLYSSTRKLDIHFYQDGYNYRGIFNDLLNEWRRNSHSLDFTEDYWLSTQNIDEYSEKFFYVTIYGETSMECSGNCDDFVTTMYVKRFGANEVPITGPNQTIVVPAYITQTKCAGICPTVETLFLGLLENPKRLDGLLLSESVKSMDLLMSKNQFDVYEDMRNAFSGNALGNYGRLSRALYFSTTVITTLGFGDVIPVSDTARNAIMMQAMLGLFLIGAFFNSLSLRAPKRQANE